MARKVPQKVPKSATSVPLLHPRDRDLISHECSLAGHCVTRITPVLNQAVKPVTAEVAVISISGGWMQGSGADCLTQ